MATPNPAQRYAYDAQTFEALVQRYAAGELTKEGAVIDPAPRPIGPDDPDTPVRLAPSPREDAQEAQSVSFRAAGRAAIRAGRIGLVIMAGGMATRFGGGAKGVVRLLDDQADSFLALALQAARRVGLSCGGEIPVAIMTSFATSEAVDAELHEIDWAGTRAASRHRFEQSVLPRTDEQGTALHTEAGREDWPATSTWTAPGHGDTLGRLRNSGCLDALAKQGVEQILIANVDNLGACIDPVVVGAHLAAVAKGAAISVEVVARASGDRGGCVARLADGRPAIVEAFRLPQGTSLASYPHFNTNSLWFELEALRAPMELDWFAVRKQITTPEGEALEVVQFETLIGQATEHLATALLDVPRELRFCPIKTRDDLANSADHIRARLADPDAFML